MKAFQYIIVILLAINTALIGFVFSDHFIQSDQTIPDLVGTWKGENHTVSDLKGYRDWGEKVVHITEQQDRRFRGTFTYSDGTKNFFGVIYPDNISFTWVASNSRGYNHGRILGKDTIAPCYVETWEEATAGCATLHREK